MRLAYKVRGRVHWTAHITSAHIHGLYSYVNGGELKAYVFVILVDEPVTLFTKRVTLNTHVNINKKSSHIQTRDL